MLAEAEEEEQFASGAKEGKPNVAEAEEGEQFASGAKEGKLGLSSSRK